jgi:hypothetical protein
LQHRSAAAACGYSRKITINTALAAAAFMLMFNVIEEIKKLKREVRWWMKEWYRQRMQDGNRLM